MKQFKNATFLTVLYLASLGGGTVLAQNAADNKSEVAPQGKTDESAMMAMMMELAKPGENHKVLAGMVGQWNYKVKYWMNPDPKVPPSESSGTSQVRSVMDGRYIISEHSGKFQMPGPDGTMQNAPFLGMEISGYDNVHKQFVSSWIDNFGTGILNSTGDFDPAAKTLTYTAEYEPAPGMKTKMRQVITMTDSDHHSMVYYEMRGSKEFKTMEINYARAALPADATPSASAASTP
jgi:hypothetical protein